MHQTPTDWQRAITLLDVALALPAAQREPWLSQTGVSDPGVMPILRKLLDAHGRIETHQILATLPKIQRSARRTDAGAAGLHIGPFELIAPLGRGGMGSVWRARYADARMQRDVAIKLPASTDDAAALVTLRERFARERDFLAQLQHPNIARLYDAGVSDRGQPYLAMEYVAGAAIDAHCDAAQLPIKARLRLFLQVLDAVAYAHQQLVLHRDLKAGNVLVDQQGQVRLLDFGVARLLPPPLAPDAPGDAPLHGDVRTGANADGELTERAGAAFTLGHAAPEQINHGALSTATDVYALGVMLYRLLTGLSPYQPVRDTRGALEDAVLLATPVAASTRAFLPQTSADRQSTNDALRKALRGDLDVILSKALKKNPNDRYATVTALADDLRRHLAQQPISARPDSWAYRSSRFIARHCPALAASALALAALLATAGVAVWQAQVSAANAARASAEAARANTAQKFFAGLLSNADPEKNKSVTSADLRFVDQALVTAYRDLAASPQSLALVLKQLGELYMRFDVPTKYLEVQRKRVSLLETLPDRKTDDFVDAQIELARALSRSDVAEERKQALPSALAAYQQALTEKASSRLVVTALCLIVDLHAAESNNSVAHQFAVLAVSEAKSARPVPLAELSLAYAELGVTSGRLGDFDGARQAFRESIAIDAGENGRDKVEQVHTRMVLANMEYEAGHFEASRREALAVIEFASQNLGEMEGTLFPARVRAVLATTAMGEFEPAWKLAQHLLTIDLQASDPLRSAVAHYANGVAAMLAGHFAQAEQSYLRAEPGIAIRPGVAINLKTRQAELQLRQGLSVQAHASLASLLERARVEGRFKSEEHAMALERAGVALARQGRLADARTAFFDACAGRRDRLVPAHPSRVRCESYGILISVQQTPGEQKNRLSQQLLALREGSAGRTALAASLQAALDWAASRAEGESRLSDFPLLN